MSVTLSQLITSFKNKLNAQDSAINADAPNGSWDILSGAVGAEFLDLYFNLELVRNSIYPQFAVGQQIDQILYSRGLPARLQNTFGTVNCECTSTLPVTIPENTVFTANDTGNQYINLLTTTLDTSNLPASKQITLYAVKAGSSIFEETGAVLTFDTITLGALSSSPGLNRETDEECIIRILQSIRAPQGNVRVTDYQIFMLLANSLLVNPTITNSIIIPEFQDINDVFVLGASPLVGTSITEFQLNSGLLPATSFSPYSRLAGSTVLSAADQYIQSQRLVGLTVLVIPTTTFFVGTVTLQVSLATGYDLTTIVEVASQSQSGAPITIELTVEQVIQKEVRRAICDQPFGGTIIAGTPYITLDSIAYAVNSNLSVLNGSLIKILTNLIIAGTDIVVPAYGDFGDHLEFVYDVNAYTDIVVTAV